MQLFICLILLPFAYSADHTPCCASHQFTATLQEIGGYLGSNGVPAPIDLTAQLFYDYDKKLLRADRTMVNDDGSVSLTKVIEDHVHKKRYTIQNNKCAATPLVQPIQDPCIPSDATFIGTQVLGPSGNSVTVNSYRMDYQAQYNMTIKLSMTTDDCTPVVYSTYGIIQGAPTEVTYFFENFKAGVDASAFNVPAICHV